MARFILSLVRPLVTLIGWWTVSYMVIEQIDVPQWYIGAVLGMTGWWFYDRHQLHKKERNNAG